MTSHRPKLAVVASHPVQYWVPVYRKLAESNKIDIQVFYVAENGAYEYFDAQFNQVIKWDIPLTQGYEHVFLKPGLVLEDYGFFTVDAANINDQLNLFAPDFIWLNGYAQRINWRVLKAFSGRAHLMFTSDSNLQDSRHWWRSHLKSWVVRYFFRRIDSFLSCSPKNTEYLLHYGAPSNAIVHSVFPVDTQRLLDQQQKITPERSAELRRKLQLTDEDSVLLFAGKLIPHKRPEDMIYLVAGLLLMVGNGEMLDELKRLAADLGVEKCVRFAGFVNQSNIGEYFALGDLFVFPSSKEPFGVIASEVLPFGLPIIAAQTIGAVGASIIEGENALLYPCGDIASLLSATESLLTDKGIYQRFSGASVAMATEFDTTVLADDILDLCDRK